MAWKWKRKHRALKSSLPYWCNCWMSWEDHRGTLNNTRNWCVGSWIEILLVRSYWKASLVPLRTSAIVSGLDSTEEQMSSRIWKDVAVSYMASRSFSTLTCGRQQIKSCIYTKDKFLYVYLKHFFNKKWINHMTLEAFKVHLLYLI